MKRTVALGLLLLAVGCKKKEPELQTMTGIDNETQVAYQVPGGEWRCTSGKMTVEEACGQVNLNINSK